jgi:hypothetical protein
MVWHVLLQADTRHFHYTGMTMGEIHLHSTKTHFISQATCIKMRTFAKYSTEIKSAMNIRCSSS